MFQHLASYLLGSVTNPEDEGTTEEGVRDQVDSRRLISIMSDDDDWVLVDRDSEGNSEVSSLASLDIEQEDECEPKLPQLSALSHQLTRTSSTSSLPCTSTMEESWFLTPPPCFTSAGPIHMETSPLENLLIEHPSMSVYQHTHHRRPGVTVGAASPAEDEDEYEVEDDRGDDLVVVHRAPLRYRLHVIQQQERQCVKNKQAQKVQIQKASQSLKKSYLERTNKAREVNYRNRRQRRGERSQGAKRSHANNNRKC